MRWWKGAVLIGMRWLHRRHRWTLLRDCLGEGRDLLLAVRVSRVGRQRGIDCGAHVGRFSERVVNVDGGRTRCKFKKRDGATTKKGDGVLAKLQCQVKGRRNLPALAYIAHLAAGWPKLAARAVAVVVVVVVVHFVATGLAAAVTSYFRYCSCCNSRRCLKRAIAVRFQSFGVRPFLGFVEPTGER